MTPLRSKPMRRLIAIAAVVGTAGLALIAQSIAGAAIPRRIAINGLPLAITTGYGSVWVAGHEGTTLYRIDPATAKITGRFEEGTNACGPLGVAFGDIWVGPCDSSPATTAVRATTGRVVGHLSGVDSGFGAASAWTDGGDGSPTVELRVDPHTFRVTSRIRVGNGGGGVAAGGGFIWRVNAADGTVSKIDPNRNTVASTIRYGAPGAAYATYTSGRLWIFDATDDAIVNVDPASSKVTRLQSRLHDGGAANGDPYLAVDGERIWVLVTPTKLGAIDVRTSKIVRQVPVPSGFGPYFAIAHHSIWGSVPDSDIVLRIPLP